MPALREEEQNACIFSSGCYGYTHLIARLVVSVHWLEAFTIDLVHHILLQTLLRKVCVLVLEE